MSRLRVRNQWSQGDLIEVDHGSSLSAGDGDSRWIVVSHDCDISRSCAEEPYIECISARIVPINGSLTKAKSTRTLHLECSGLPDKHALELVATEKRSIKKELFDGFEADDGLVVSDGERKILKRWLASRYDRDAFPDEFNKRLNKAARKLKGIADKLGATVSFVLFRTGEGQDRELTPDENYLLEILIVYRSDLTSAQPADEAEEMAEKFAEAFKVKFLFDGKRWEDIELRSCFPVADGELTVEEFESYRIWQLEYLSLGDP